MEDDDEFGDLYTDVLQSFQSSQPSSAPPPPPQLQPPHPPIDLNLKTGPAAAAADEILPPAPAQSNPNSQTLAPDSAPRAYSQLGARVLEAGDVKLGSKDSDLNEKEVDFDIEEEEGSNGIPGIGFDAVIPGLSGAAPVSSTAEVAEYNPEGTRRDPGGDDWDSDDSEDDLQIVLNDNNPMGMERGNGGDDDDGLVIVGDSELHGAAEEQEWGEEGQQAAEGERKEMGEAGRGGGGGPMVAPKIGFSNHGYHPFHSQFKYVRPGAMPIAGPTNSGPGGVPGQVRPLGNMGPTPGRGRGDWRPTGLKNGTPLQKNFHSNFGTPGWGSNMGGRGFGGGLEFTLPSHKTIFDVDIDGFEEKPWKYPGVDTSDFFNFGLNEDTWRDYCKQLEQLRLESTMQSKIRVYESGRTEQEYDPDLPPELAAATGMHDFPTESTNPGKSEGGQSDFAKGPARLRPPIPTGRAIQVESGYGERVPSSENRPQRMRDSDAVIEIVLQDSLDDDTSAGIPDGTENDLSKEDVGRSSNGEGDLPQDEKPHFNGLPQALNNQKSDPLGRKRPYNDSVPEDDESLPIRPEVSIQHAGSGDHTPSSAGGSYGENRGTQRRARERSPRSTRGKKFLDNHKEGSVESVDGGRSPLISSPISHGAARESSVERKSGDQDEPLSGDESSGMEKEDMDVNVNDGVPNHKLSPQVERSADEELDDGDDSKAARSSDNSKARSGSSRDYQKWRDGVEEEVIQGRSGHSGGIKSHLDGKEQGFQRKGRDGRQEPDRSQMLVKGREGSYPYRDWDPNSTHHLQFKNDALYRRKERENIDGAWQRRDDDPYSRRIRTEEPRKRDRGDEMGSRHRSKVRESERSDKDEYMQSRKQLDNGSYRAFYDKDAVGSRPRERDDGLKGRYEHIDDYHGKRRKDEEYMRRDQIDKEELLQGHRDTTTHRKRDRDEVLDQRKRDDQQKVRDNPDEHHSVRHKDGSWLQRERGDRQREREEWHRLKQSHEENIPKRDRDDGRVSVRGGRVSEDKAWVGHGRVKDENKGSDKEHQYKETVRHSEPSKRRDRIEEDSSHHRGREDAHARGNQMNIDERRSDKERSSTRNERADSQKVHDRKHKENSRRSKETETADISTSITSKRHQEDQSGRSREMGLKGTREQGLGHSSKRHKEDASSDDEQEDLKKGRSKLERWTSHKERDFSINSKSPSNLKLKELDRGSSDTSKLPDDSSKLVEAVNNQHPLADENVGDQDVKDADTKPVDSDTIMEGRHLDTVEKLKKRSERFKLPLPSEKEPSTIKKIETEVLPSPNSDPPVVESEIKPERPARKRRWVSN
ncbi:FIP1[V]-like protein [Argentina anserina]|uniref:FIP1[V]-like protein n=1 Tax=Argentina anserina TaxID=57926 RepID=UPI0021762D70|nr:FIP1[V]-like protein [Potentilla anserina]